LRSWRKQGRPPACCFPLKPRWQGLGTHPAPGAAHLSPFRHDRPAAGRSRSTPQTPAVSAAPVVPAKQPPQLNARHVVWSGIAGILTVLAAGAITYLFTHPNNSSQWADVIRSIVLAVAAMGAFPAAYVAYRKQRITEADHHLEQDKEERRRGELTEATVRADRKDFNDRFTAATQQISSDKAPIRLAGVYALAQLADEWGRGDPAQRQTCIDVLCSYLRMPWPDSGFPKHGTADATAGTTGRSRTHRMLSTNRLPLDGSEAGPPARQEEARVRETILRVIAVHLRKDRNTDGWQDNDFDLTRAKLPEIDFSDAVCHGRFTFIGATFTQHTFFCRATFTQDADFSGGTFTQHTFFRGATFTQHTFFRRATFNQDAVFSGATFTQHADFARATFNQGGFFDGATFTQDADFARATFNQYTNFRGATAAGSVTAPRWATSQGAGVPRSLGPLLGLSKTYPPPFDDNPE